MKKVITGLCLGFAVSASFASTVLTFNFPNPSKTKPYYVSMNMNGHDAGMNKMAAKSTDNTATISQKEIAKFIAEHQGYFNIGSNTATFYKCDQNSPCNEDTKVSQYTKSFNLSEKGKVYTATPNVVNVVWKK